MAKTISIIGATDKKRLTAHGRVMAKTTSRSVATNKNPLTGEKPLPTGGRQRLLVLGKGMRQMRSPAADCLKQSK